jgi:3'-phosphoadenosine 5'-phosphosulfate sulfotransferase (PAPS reductase)/FAD synthetase
MQGSAVNIWQGKSRQAQGESMRTTSVLSYGGGVNTTALMVLLVRKKMPFDVAVFADTGGELPETYTYLDVARRYLERHGIELKVVRSKNGTLYDTCRRRKVIPSKLWRWSTRDYKITPIHAYYRSLGTRIREYLGIAYDEIERMKENREPYIRSEYPLVDWKMTRADCIQVIKSAHLPVPVKSGCYFCPFQDVPRWQDLYIKHNDLFLKAMELEESSKHFPEQRLNRYTLRGLLRRGFRDSGQLRTLSDEPCGAYCMA